MAITESPHTSGSQASASSATTASITPTANRLQLLTVFSSCATTPVNTPTVTGAGMTWEVVVTIETALNAGTSRYGRGTTFRAMSASPGSGALTIDFAGQSNHIDWSVAEFAGIHTGGTNGSAAVRNVASVVGTGAGEFLPFTTPILAASGGYSAYGAQIVATPIPDGTQIHYVSVGSPGPCDLLTAWKATPSITNSTQNGNNAAHFHFSIELRDAADPNNDGAIPTIVAQSNTATTGTTGATNGSLTYTFTGAMVPANGDIFVAVQTIAHLANTAFTLGTTPAGWTLITSNLASANASRPGVAVYIRKMNGTETSLVVPALATGGASTDGHGLKVIKLGNVGEAVWDTALNTTPAATAAVDYTINGQAAVAADVLCLYICGGDATNSSALPVSMLKDLLEVWDFQSDPGEAQGSCCQTIIAGPAGVSPGNKVFTAAGSRRGAGVFLAFAASGPTALIPRNPAININFPAVV